MVERADSRGAGRRTASGVPRQAIMLAAMVGMAIALSLGVFSTEVASATPGAAAAGTGGSLSLAARGPAEADSGARLPIELVITNQGQRSCGVSTALTAPVITGVTRAEQPVQPSLRGPTFFTAGLSAPEESLTELPVGGSVTLAVPTEPGSVLSVSDLPVGAGTGLVARWALGEPGVYRITVGLAPTAVSDCAAPEPAVLEVRVSQGLPVPILALVAAVVLVAAFGALAMRRRRSTVALLVLVLAGAEIASPSPAAARIVAAGNPGTNAAVAKCIAIFEGPGGDPAGVYAQAKSTGKQIEIVDAFSEASSTAPSDMNAARDPKKGTGSTISFFPNSSLTYDGVSADDCSTLYHELTHAVAAANGQTNTTRCPSGVSLEEARASLAENQFRRARGLKERTGYDGKALPKAIGECQGPKGPPKRGFRLACDEGPCAESNGDPHLRTWDDLDYDLQSVGEFVLARSDDGSFEVQARQVPYGASRSVSVNAALAARVGGQRVMVAADVRGLRVTIDGEPLADLPADIALGDGGRLELVETADEVAITWPDGSAANLYWLAGYGVDIDLQLAEGRRGTMSGLFGNFDGEPRNDLRLADGTPMPDNLSWEHRHGQFADSWRVTDETSLFDYAAGTSTETFTDRTFPDGEIGLDNLAQADFGRALCEELGVAADDEATLDDCAFDLLVTGQAAFGAAPASRAPAFAPIPEPGPTPTPSGEGPASTFEPPPSIRTTSGGPIGPGDTVRGVIEEPNDRHVYTFTVEPRTVAFFQAATDCISQDLVWYLTTPGAPRDGASLEWPMCFDMGRREFVQGGDFELVVEGKGNVGPYEFSWIPVKPDDRQPLVFDEPMTGSIDGMAEHDVFTFSGLSGDKLEVTGTECEGDFTWAITQPSFAYGGFEFGVLCGESEPVRLDLDGEYELAVSGSPEDRGRYEFEVTRLCRNC